MPKTIVFDFDGVIHSYSSGWKGIDVIPDPPVEGIKEVIDFLREKHYEVIIVSSRCCSVAGRTAIDKWLNKYEINVDKVCTEKPPALVYIDDRAICFDGDPKSLIYKIENFKPWYKRDVKKLQNRSNIDIEKSSAKALVDFITNDLEYMMSSNIQETPSVEEEDIPNIYKWWNKYIKWLSNK